MTTTEQIKQLRDQTGAGVLEAKRVLDQSDGDFQKALSILKAKGLAAADKKAERAAREGVIECYVHAGGRVGVIVELNCETDFVARLDIFKQLAHDIALQVAANSPRYISTDDIPAEVLAERSKTFEEATRAEGKAEAIIPKIVQGKLEKYFTEVCLYRQPFIKDDSITIEELIKIAIAQTKENIVVRRFVRYALGE